MDQVAADEKAIERWRPTPGVRIAFVLMGAAFLALDGLVVPGSPPGVAPLIWCAAAVVLLLSWRLGFVPFIEARPEALVIQNPLRRREFAWSAIERVKPTYSGLLIIRKDGGWPTAAWAVQKSNFAVWTHRWTRADEVTEVLMARVQAAAQEHVQAPLEGSRPGAPSTARSLRGLYFLSFAYLALGVLLTLVLHGVVRWVVLAIFVLVFVLSVTLGIIVTHALRGKQEH